MRRTPRRLVFVLGAASLAGSALAGAASGADLRVPIVEHLVEGRPERALQEAERIRRESSEASARVGLSYLRGRLLDRLGRPVESEEAFAATLAETPGLEHYVRYHLARAQERDGHPEVAAGLVASVVTAETADDLLDAATELFARSINGGGDCRILRGVRARRLPERIDRRLRVVAGQCRLRQGEPTEAAETLCGLLQESRKDDPALRAAHLLDGILRRELDQRRDLRRELDRRGCELELEIGLALHHHREYDRSISYLERAIGRLPSRRIVADDEEFEARYALARGYFWRERFRVAAERFAALALRARDLEERSRVLYQQGRCLELLGDWTGADAVYRRTYGTFQQGRFAGPALLAALRLEWIGGRERDALDLYRLLSGHRGSERYAARAALFLAVSDLVRGRSDRAGAWLDDAERFDRETGLEATYWRGRTAELQAEAEGRSGAGAVARAIDHYLEVLAEDPYHPLALDAAARLRDDPLGGPAATEAARRIGGGDPEDLLAAWLVLGDERPAGRDARRRLIERAATAGPSARFFGLDPVPVAEWPLWEASLDESSERLLALGLVDEGASAVTEHFPANRPELAYTGSRLLLAAGQVRRAILLSDNASRPLARRLKAPLLPDALRRVLYPFPWSDRIRAQAERFGVDPHLLASVIREESRFQPDAISAVSARGLTQFVWLTAERLAAELGLGPIRPRDLYDPELSITLGAAYLGELLERFGGLEHQAVASYNAGPAQARLWQTHCYGRGMPEYFTKVGFVQTRGYLEKVLGGRAQYRELYGEGSSPPRPSAGADGGESAGDVDSGAVNRHHPGRTFRASGRGPGGTGRGPRPPG